MNDWPQPLWQHSKCLPHGGDIANYIRRSNQHRRRSTGLCDRDISNFFRIHEIGHAEFARYLDSPGIDVNSTILLDYILRLELRSDNAANPKTTTFARLSIWLKKHGNQHQSSTTANVSHALINGASLAILANAIQDYDVVGESRGPI